MATVQKRCRTTADKNRASSLSTILHSCREGLHNSSCKTARTNSKLYTTQAGVRCQHEKTACNQHLELYMYSATVKKKEVALENTSLPGFQPRKKKKQRARTINKTGSNSSKTKKWYVTSNHVQQASRPQEKRVLRQQRLAAPITSTAGKHRGIGGWRERNGKWGSRTIGNQWDAGWHVGHAAILMKSIEFTVTRASFSIARALECLLKIGGLIREVGWLLSAKTEYNQLVDSGLFRCVQGLNSVPVPICIHLHTHHSNAFF